MKLKHLSLCFAMVAACSASAQIKYRDTEKKPALIPYDSSIAFQHLTPDIAQLTLVGQEITFLKLNPKRLIKNKEDTLLDNIKMKAVVEVPYKSVLKGGHFYTPYKAVENKTFRIVDYDRKNMDGGVPTLIFTLRDEDRKLLLFQVPEDNLPATPVIINGNYEWLKRQYVGKELHLRKDNHKTENVLDNNKEMLLSKSDVFSCTEIAVIFSGKQKYGQPFLIVKNSDNVELAIGVGSKNEYAHGPLIEDFELQ
ncbi:hypothetical protein ACTJJ0_22925 [Chitinophaga sp. 22321]|uniref:Uncharacterized protein n=1 Tax=Chitinophaga hostae TaxID=2831022 RepID=A0ABS5J8B4_9BACT|nr:hypothetical protein [Chitinophaga hostae]MBS0031456.1 hypothetical protein [Chitinophaga hostae]